jgi:hypothetical protein
MTTQHRDYDGIEGILACGVRHGASDGQNPAQVSSAHQAVERLVTFMA